MVNFNEYQAANLQPKHAQNISNLEKQLKQDAGEDVILVAYQKKSQSQNASNKSQAQG